MLEQSDTTKAGALCLHVTVNTDQTAGCVHYIILIISTQFSHSYTLQITGAFVGAEITWLLHE